MKFFLSAAAAALLGLAAPAPAASYSNEILSIGMGSRALGMGGAFVAVADDASASYWNPAGLAGVKGWHLSATQQGRQGGALGGGTNEVGSQYFTLSAARDLGAWGGAGITLLRFAVDGIDQIASSWAPGDAPLGQFGSQDLGALLAYGRELVPGLDLGAGLKILSGGTQGLKADGGAGLGGDASYSDLGLDLALRVRFGAWSPSLKGLSLGLNLQDAYNSQVAWSTGRRDPVDINGKAGLAWAPQWDFMEELGGDLTLAADLDPKYSTLLHLGLELWLQKALAFRAGLRQFSDGRQSAETSLGASFRIYRLQADYAYVSYQLTPVHYFSLGAHF